MNSKKGLAISMIIIIGLIMLMLMFFAYAMRSQLVDIMKPKSTDASSVQIYVENCINAVSQYAIYKIGKQGGSIKLANSHFSTPFLYVNYAYDNGKNFPEIETVKSEIESFVNENLETCTANFGGFALKGVDVKAGEVNSSAIFSSKSVIITVSYPLQIISDNGEYSLEKFQVEIPAKLSFIHSKTENFLSGFEKGYDMTYLRTFNSNIYIAPFENSDLFTIESADSRIFSDPYLFLFSVK